MATRTKEEFEQLGYRHASNGDVRSYKPDSTSWQGIAYNAGVKRYGAQAAERAYKAGPGGAETQRAVELHKQPAGDVKLVDRGQTFGEFPVVGFAYRSLGKSRMDEMMREAGYPPPPPSPPKAQVKVWFDELQHNTPANRWSTEPGFERWPVGAVAHIQDLKRQLLVSQDPKRTERLQTTITRMYKRHGAPA